MKWFRLVSIAFLMLAMLLWASPVVYADDPPDEDSDMKVDVEIDGDLKVNIGVSGPAELNVGVEGPSEIHIDAGDEVNLNVEASDESQVFIEGQKLDEPTGCQETGDDDPGEDLDNYSLKLDDYISRLDGHLAIISVAFPAVGLLTFFLMGLL